MIFLKYFIIFFAIQIVIASIEEQEKEAEKLLADTIKALEINAKWKYDLLFEDKGKLPLISEVGAIFELNDLSNFINTAMLGLNKYEYKNFTNEDLKLQIQRLVEQTLPLNNEITNKTNEFHLFHDIFEESILQFCKNKNDTTCDAMLIDIYEETPELDDHESTKHIWSEFHKKAEYISTETFHQNMSEELQKAENENNKSTSPAGYIFKEYYDDHIFDKVSLFVEQLHPFYMQLHAHIRHSLGKIHGRKIIPDKESIRVDLYENWFLKVLKHETGKTHPFPDTTLINYTQAMLTQNYTSIKLMELADEFFVSMNMTKATDKFWKNIKLTQLDDLFGTGRDISRSRFCSPLAFDVYAKDDVGYNYCNTINLKNLLDTQKSMTAIQYFYNKQHLPLPYRLNTPSGFTESFGRAIALSVSNENHMEKLHLINSKEFPQEININRLYFMAIDIIVPLLYDFLGQRFYFDYFLKMPSQSNSYNCYFWQLYNEYLGVHPPIERTGCDSDFAVELDFKSLRTIPIKDIFTEIIGFKLYETFCKIAGEYNEDDSTKPLDQCDFYGSIPVGKTLKKIMSLGSSKPWQEIMKIATEDIDLDASSFLKYFEPLHKWLEENNKKNGIHVGWDHVDKCHPCSE